ncbi:16S rRNA (guanine(966)-N(2))-methyltransferase RsmD [Halomonas sp. TRM85114]|uniref:16S rRNA (guanine(966)-N(2))-methyltransferase RsmD n=1 Tax=Halomonas jincaotanensis TaxID=2810616 RepID=UPI001BD6160F|nr:16S rRNA (guanine(966)-N(2))-methyltransferase RsmD [Halomonas jincaotanensis]MBS9403057.1 16S rRNA (guanine(966)-N(2))-methyltransferase RsmD [Halomonas jincaotanensis]
MTPRRSPSRRSRRSPGVNGTLRLIGGEYRRRRLPVLDSPGLRPTPDRVRETLFNWLATLTPGARVLDLFAGTGALGLEALSRGASEACFVECDPQVARQLADNLATLGAEPCGRVVTSDAVAFLGREPSPHSLVFIDPPFHQGFAAACCAALEAGWLGEDAFIYLETEAMLEPEVPAHWQLHREVRAGDSHGRLYRRQVVANTAGGSPDSNAC